MSIELKNLISTKVQAEIVMILINHVAARNFVRTNGLLYEEESVETWKGNQGALQSLQSVYLSLLPLLSIFWSRTPFQAKTHNLPFQVVLVAQIETA